MYPFIEIQVVPQPDFIGCVCPIALLAQLFKGAIREQSTQWLPSGSHCKEEQSTTAQQQRQ